MARAGLFESPYGSTLGKSNQVVWSAKLIAEYQARRVTEAALLVNAKLGYDWFSKLLKHWPICLAYERISFINAVTLVADKGPSK